ncbi:CYTH and CHAD domain-containing protein [Kocuria turfanensis]|uniref:CHAD domain-containing protein n=1 Tax=Kocuria turfanensis TaxID=388357 RepID=A0A512I895_9MICC|nr:CYTH and CHAD domain-containing protein [Kocuria turfanensis]GEO93893.1 CHAD domain-containing protein [Kocuria turfanensis]
MTAVAHREVERKYEVPEGAESRIDWSGLPGYTVSAEPVEHRMEAVYYDTEDMALGRRSVALRRRRGGADDGWHVKFSEATGRREWQVPLLRTPDRMPAAVRHLLAGLTGGEPLRPIATLRTVRRVLMVSDAGGGEVAELAADVVEAVDERTGTARSWSEWEVELLDGSIPEERQQEIFDAVESSIFAVGGRPSSSRAKIARALGAEDGAEDRAGAPAPGGPAQEAEEAGRTTGKDSAGDEGRQDGKTGQKTGKKKGQKTGKKKGQQKGQKAKGTGPEVLRTVLEGLAEQLVLWDFKVRLDAPDAVHQMRVTSRSLRSVLRAAGPFFAGDTAQELDGRLRELAGALSAARDAEVTAELLAGRVAALDGRVGAAAAEVLQRAAEEQAHQAAGTVRRHVTSPEHLQLLADVRAFAAAPPLTEECAELSAREVADALVHRALRKVVRVAERGAAAEEAGETAQEQRLEHLHDVRKAVKRVRYVDGVLGRAGFRPGKSLRRAARDAEDYQDALGRVMDATVVERWLAGRAKALQGSGEDRYAVGLLHGAEVSRLHAGAEGGSEVVGVLLSQLRADLA